MRTNCTNEYRKTIIGFVTQLSKWVSVLYSAVESHRPSRNNYAKDYTHKYVKNIKWFQKVGAWGQNVKSLEELEKWSKVEREEAERKERVKKEREERIIEQRKERNKLKRKRSV